MMAPSPNPSTVTLGIDPGGRSTGVVIRRRDELLAAAVIERHPSNVIDDHEYGLALWVRQAVEETDRLLGATLEVYGPAAVEVAVETFRRPSPHARRTDGNSLTNVDGLLATAAVVGALTRRHGYITRLVEPGGHGSRPDGTYPLELRPKASTTRKGPPADRLRHARSAWDIAGAAILRRAYHVATRDHYADRLPAKVTTVPVTARR